MEISDQWTAWPCRPAKTPRRRPTKDEGQQQVAQKSPGSGEYGIYPAKRKLMLFIPCNKISSDKRANFIFRMRPAGWLDAHGDVRGVSNECL